MTNNIINSEYLAKQGINTLYTPGFVMAYDQAPKFNERTNRLESGRISAEYTIDAFKHRRRSDYIMPTKASGLGLANDSNVALQNPVNVAGPIYPGLIYINPNVIPTLVTANPIEEHFPATIVGSFETHTQSFMVKEFSGHVNVYSDRSAGPDVQVTYTQHFRDQYRFNASATLGDLEMETSNSSGINLMADLQEAAALTFAKAHEKIALFGVKGLLNDGLLNNTAYPAAQQAASVTVAGKQVTKWEDKIKDRENGPGFIAQDIIDTYNRIRKHTRGLVNGKNTKFVLYTSVQDAVYLDAYNNFKQSVKEIIAAAIPDIEYATIPQLDDVSSGRSFMLIPMTVGSVPTIEVGMTEKMSFVRQIQYEHHLRMSYRAGTWGVICRYPEAIHRTIIS